MEIVIFTDGAVKGNGGPGVMGMAAVVTALEAGVERYTRTRSWRVEADHVTNNLAELLAVQLALGLLQPAIKGRLDLTVYTDSELVVRWISGRYNCTSHPVLLAEIKAALGEFKSAAVRHCKGHAGNPLNEKCDMLARLEAGTWTGK